MAMYFGFAMLTYSGYNLLTPQVFVLGHTYRALMYIMLLFVACFASHGVVGAILRTAMLRELGLISYGLFLFHEMVLDILSSALLGTMASAGEWELWFVAFDAFVITILIAELTWHFVEMPMIARGKRSGRQ
jgi:peptidoglycan/LPS O-acetylase OafA/YrhL